MAAQKSNIYSAVAAGLLSVLTLLTFYLLRNYGPEGTLWRFHNAAVANDQRELARVSLQPLNDTNVGALFQFVREAGQQGAKPEVRDARYSPQETIIRISYVLPDGRPLRTIDWVLEKNEVSSWTVDADGTMQTLAQ